MIEPLNQFADRMIRNGEVGVFIKGLLDKGVPEIVITDAIHRFSDQKETLRHQQVHWTRYGN